MEPIGVIYCARNMINQKVYIGMSKLGLRSRKAQHLRYAKNGGNYAFHRAIRKYGAQNFSWSVLVCGEVDELKSLEIATIALYRKQGFELYNHTDGGEGFSDPTGEIRKKINNTLKKPEVKEKLSKIQRVKQNLPEVKEKNRASVKAAWERPETRAKILAAQKLSRNRPEVQANQVINTRAAMSRPEVRANIAAGRNSIEGRTNNSKAQKRYQARRRAARWEELAKSRAEATTAAQDDG